MVYNNEKRDEIMSEAPEYSSKSEFSKPTLVSRAVENCVIARSKEMKEGYFNEQISGGEVTSKIWIADSRKTYCESVIALKILLLPEIRRNKEVKTIIEECDLEKKEIFNKYAIKKSESGEKRIPKIGDIKSSSKFILSNKTTGEGYWETTKMTGYWDNNNIFYWDEMIEVSDKLFESFNILIDSLNYFKSGAGF